MIFRMKTKLALITAGMLLSTGLCLGLVAFMNADTMAETLVGTTLQSKLEGDIRSSRLYLREYYGKVGFVDGELVDREGLSIRNRFDLVDAIQRDLGVVATVFVRDDRDFKRIATTILRDNGERAVGTLLGVQSAAYGSVMEKRRYTGRAEILNAPYLTAYDPILDENQELIGILFIGIPEADVRAIIKRGLQSLVTGVASFFLFFLLLALITLHFVLGKIVAPILQVSRGLADIAQGDGDLTMRLAVHSRDEVGDLAGWFNTFVEKLQGIVRDIGEGVETLAASSAELAAISDQMQGGVVEVAGRTGKVTLASEEMSASMSRSAAALEQSRMNTSLLAAASEEMSATIGEIAGNAGRARGVSDDAARKAFSMSSHMDSFKGSADSIGKVIETITEISEQVNLLALNATIEAARAGEAGKGFAVVAHEIKELARQTAQATQDIRLKIEDIQNTAAVTIREVGEITRVIRDASDAVGSIAASVEEQSSVAREISGNVGDVAGGIDVVHENANRNACAVDQVAKDMAGIRHAMDAMEENGSQVSASAKGLSELSEALKKMVGQFRV
ncbi:methyl-accepting chemotaxis protein [Desulfobotulus sp.]|uniref:methyl-accepting chemotaxis protein n=1 Tax=Desulfobotulus sp. TaxID=1940337 RepID=UPI002A358BED|nr:Cache 3/Cache 2 fusion domain-containing protein [Desulfobotulus sp.]MDY0162484.1 Cache 3/Cache 2 fusion domain-containing protein [Desulfobotulus sp.]